MHTTGVVHLVFAALALGSGAAVFFARKGTRYHRRLGWVYAASMVGLNGTALMIYRLFGGFGPFHVAALVSLLTILGGLVPVLTRRPRGMWLEHHAYWMCWSYAGLAAAAASEITTRLRVLSFWWLVFGATFAVIGVSRQLIKTRVPKALRSIRKPRNGRSPDAPAGAMAPSA